MAQHDYAISNQSLAAGRADLNNALAAIVSNNSGPNQPNPPYAYQPWADTTAGQLKIRNASNSAWLVLGSLADVGLGLLSRAGGTMTGPLLVAVGTAAAPGLGVAGDSNTGWYGKAGNQLGIATAGTERGFFSAAGWNGPVVGAVTTPSINGGPIAGLRNLLINANPLINQRGYVSGTATTAANQYTLDRWRVVTSGQSISWTDSANVRTVTAPAGGVEQVIEGININGGTYVLSWTGTATARVNGTTIANGGTVTLTGGANCTVQFRSGTFSLPQLEPGSLTTVFEGRSAGLELALCQRYFEAMLLVIGGYNTTGQFLRSARNFSTHKRATPTLTLAVAIESLNIQNNTIVIDSSSAAGFRLVAQVNATGDGYISQSLTASAEL
jgi:hypothetical protein